MAYTVIVMVGFWLLLGAACARGEHPGTPASAASESVSPATAIANPLVDVVARQACVVGDTLLRRVPGTAVRRPPAIAFDSLWHGSTSRWACRVAAVGHVPFTYSPIDSLIEWLKDRGWVDRTTISADGPDGTIQGIHRGSVTCLVEGRWDGGDDADTTSVRSDTMEVHLACTRTIATDTLSPP